MLQDLIGFCGYLLFLASLLAACLALCGAVVNAIGFFESETKGQAWARFGFFMLSLVVLFLGEEGFRFFALRCG